MSHIIEFHLIQNFAPSNLNRDDTGAPKDALFGGHRRARVSSQCFKRAIRIASAGSTLISEEFRAVRTKKLVDAVVAKLGKGDDAATRSRVVSVLAAAGLDVKEDGKTEYLLFLGCNEIDGFARIVSEHWDTLAPSSDSSEKKSKKEARSAADPEVQKLARALLDGGKAVDVALFGRMLADLPRANQDAACQVAHAISTHRVEREFDYFTAVDDMGDADETGAGMIGQVEFNSATFYRYAALDAPKLLSNLSDDRELALAAVEAFTRATVLAIPTGKQNSFAAHNLPCFVGVCVRSGGPMNLANAFEKPVVARQDRALTGQSVEALAAHDTRLAGAYGGSPDVWGYLDITDAWPGNKGTRHETLDALAGWVKQQAEARLGE
ncbi:MAG: type I-E CRISPR-associated protein Cas7/Cse4/CasC [Burkholderiales bacterium]